MHLESDLIRCYLDRELNTEERVRADQHFAACESCRAQLNEEERLRARVRAALDPLSPEETGSSADALQRFRQKQESYQRRSGIPSRWLRPVAAVLAIAVFIGVAFSVPAVRVWASSFLRLFRVQQISVVQIDPAGFKSLQRDIFNNDLRPQFDQFFSDTIHTRKNGEPRTVATVEEAGRAAGFGVRLPASAGKPSYFAVQPSVDLSFTLDIPRLQTLLDEAGRGDIRLPENVNGQVVSAHIPASVATFFGECPNKTEKEEPRHGWREFPNCRVLVQLPGPSVAAPPDFDIVGISSTMMQIVGMPQEQARKWSESVDWTTTLVLPVPRDPRMRIADVRVDGVDGTQITVPGRRGAPPAFNILWVRDGILYTFLGQGQPEEALRILTTL